MNTNSNFGTSLLKLNGFAKAALVLGVLLSLALSQPTPAKGQTPRPSGVLTFSDGTDFFDYDIKTRGLTPYGKGGNPYRAENGYALVEDFNHDLVLVSPDGRRRTTVVSEGMSDNLSRGNFILSPDAKTVIYDRPSNDPQFDYLLVVHDVQSGKDKQHGYARVDHVTPQDWMPDGGLLAMPFGQQKTVEKGEIVPLNFFIIYKDFIGKDYFFVDQPGTKPVDKISNLRMEPTRKGPSGVRIGGKRIAFTWDTHVWIASYHGDGAKQITESDGVAVGEDYPAWSPDGNWLAVRHSEGALTEIDLVPVDGMTHSMSDNGVIRLLDKKGSGFYSHGRITWR